ncbi:uncharacterized protein Bfra_009425 [Botrytis fragariae]|uniref:Uncharacterized protein n=1 Tax=Botrytis fragariae TaxID=1964551 RepID=A0A8H6EGB0_9HELO|nr:uncharacterized protein Bfra_009425 [Botrytis fragariae]KAF5870870.1 hypothetical protein Bfra_009425 [Botrytis fragariae]
MTGLQTNKPTSLTKLNSSPGIHSPTSSGQFIPKIKYEGRVMPPVVLALQILRFQHVGLSFLCTPSTTMRLSTQ